MSTESKKNGGSVLDPLLESASDEVLRSAGTMLGQLLQRYSPLNQQIAQMEHPAGPARRLENLQSVLSAMGGFKHGRVTPEMLALSSLSADVPGSPVVEDMNPEDFGVNAGFFNELLRTHATGGDTDALINKYLKTGEGTAVNPGRYGPPGRQTRLFEGQAKVDLPGLRADFRMRTTGQDAPKQLLPNDVTGLLKLRAGIDGVNNQMQLDVATAIEAVRADQAAKIGQARSIIAQAMRGIPQLVRDFKEVLGVRKETVQITDRNTDTDGTEQVLPDGTTLTSSRSRQTNEDRDVDIVAPAVPGFLRLPSLEVHTGRSEVSRFSGAGFAMRDDEEAHIDVHRGPDAIEVSAYGDTAYAAAQVTQVLSEGMTIKFDGGSMKIGG